jgi:hypothetical protein
MAASTFPLNLPSVVYCESNDILCYSAHASPTFDDAKGRMSKGKSGPGGYYTVKNVGITGWNRDCLKVNDASFTMVQCRTGPESGLFVVDLDVSHGLKPAQVFPEGLLSQLYSSCRYVVETGSGGLHFYYKHPPGKAWRKKLNLAELAGYDTKGQLDLLADGGSVIMAGSFYKHQNNTYKYKMANADGMTTTLDDLTDMPPWLVEAVDAVVETTPTVAPPRQPAAARPTTPPVRRVVEELDLVEELVAKCLPPSFFASYDNWYRFLVCMKTINPSSRNLEIAVRACRTAPGYGTMEAETSTRRKWDEINPRGELGFGSLRYWCRHENYDKYIEILRAGFEVLLLGTVNHVAEVFAQDTAGSIVLDTNSREIYYWRYCESKRLWTHISESDIKFYFIEVMSKLCDRVRGDLMKRGEEANAKKAVKLYTQIAGGNCEHFLKALRTILNPELASFSAYKDREFKLNERPELLPLRNGVFNFDTGILEPYDRSHFLTYKIDIDYDPEADTGDIDAAFKQWYRGDIEKIEFLKYWLGYCLTGYTDRQEFLLIYGPDGGNGKSLLFEEILGQ